MRELNLSIQLKNIDLSGITFIEELNKVDEESKELQEALFVYMYSNINPQNENIKKAKHHVIEEFWDIVQANLGVLDKLGIKADEVMKGYSKHLAKLKDRPRVKED
ncbi:hypothetical protein [Clostridium taeniosporum]|uniref:NTP pyrophosphohydrolase MazG putative catalytic core domain-containing protein n=1 Tax=Clostridium taeniosporum TaxID=394958 RepID=A0A1D7XLS3_9CLOT|nr:hypothetical protein [Clostridium taeniosporum]AOR24313.1 hypothetical protein BGI42_11460 [Clostridium taeniosporum]